MFALQNGGWCASGSTPEETYNKYGKSNVCRGDGKGGPRANMVYGIGGQWENLYGLLYFFAGRTFVCQKCDCELYELL